MKEELLIEGLKALNLELDAETCHRLVLFAEELQRWNRKVNLTAITRDEEVVEKHLLDSLSLLPFLEEAERLLDIGSGGGFPVLPIKIARPLIEAVSVDAVQKKILFQRHAARQLQIEGFKAVHGRIETLAQEEGMREAFSVVVSRALSDLATFVAWSMPFLSPSGRVIAMKGKEGDQELTSAEKALSAAGLELIRMERIRLPFSGSVRHILVFQRNARTPIS